MRLIASQMMGFWSEMRLVVVVVSTMMMWSKVEVDGEGASWYFEAPFLCAAPV